MQNVVAAPRQLWDLEISLLKVGGKISKAIRLSQMDMGLVIGDLDSTVPSQSAAVKEMTISATVEYWFL